MQNNIKVSIITVCLNNEKTIERTIKSVLNQNYKNIEYIIIDGKSTDNTLNIIEKYRDDFINNKIDFKVVSESDAGMYDALNKGARLCAGDLVGQINSDDWYEVNAVETMVNLFIEEKYDIAWGSIVVHSERKSFIKKAKYRKKLWLTSDFCHPSMFSKRGVLIENPYRCQSITDDFDFATRIRIDTGKKIVVTEKIISHYTFGGMGSKKSIKNMKKRIQQKYSDYRRYGMSRFYWFYCVGVEVAKYLFGKG